SYPRPILDDIRTYAAAAGMAFNPPIPMSTIEGLLDACDFVLAMTVMPGYGGQELTPAVLEKVRTLRASLPTTAMIEVDGGINEETIAVAAAAGAEMFVVGSGIFKSSDYARSMRELRHLAKQVQ